jgi:hypothetical protein
MKKLVVTLSLVFFVSGILLSESPEFRKLAGEWTGAPKFSTIIPLPPPPPPQPRGC